MRNISDKINSSSEGISTSKNLDSKTITKDVRLECLKKYLKEDRFILPIEAKNRLQEEFDLKLSMNTVKKDLAVLREELGPDYVDLDPSTIKIRQLNYRSKLKDSHLEFLKNYLKEDSFIIPVEAKNKLQGDFNIKISIYTIRYHLKKLRNELNIQYINLDPSTVKSRQVSSHTKLKNSHLECLKKYLKEDNFIQIAQAKVRLQEETGLEISYSPIQKAIKKLRKEMNLEYSNLDPSIVKNRKSISRTKLKESHLECLKKYLKEDSKIGPTEAKNRLQGEAGIDVNIQAIYIHLRKLNTEMVSDHDKLGSSTVINAKPGRRHKVSDSHLERLKKYLQEDKFILPIEAKNRLQEEFDLKLSMSTVKKDLAVLREELGPDYVDLDPSTIKIRQLNYRSKLKDSHLELLEKYLNEDNFISLNEANNKLKEETGLEISRSTIHRIMKKLRKEMNLEYSNLDPFTVKIRQFSSNTKLKNSHLECLKKYLKEDSYIGPTKAKNKLQEETGLNVTISAIHKAMKKLRIEISP